MSRRLPLTDEEVRLVFSAMTWNVDLLVILMAPPPPPPVASPVTPTAGSAAWSADGGGVRRGCSAKKGWKRGKGKRRWAHRQRAYVKIAMCPGWCAEAVPRPAQAPMPLAMMDGARVPPASGGRAAARHRRAPEPPRPVSFSRKLLRNRKIVRWRDILLEEEEQQRSHGDDEEEEGDDDDDGHDAEDDESDEKEEEEGILRGHPIAAAPRDRPEAAPPRLPEWRPAEVRRFLRTFLRAFLLLVVAEIGERHGVAAAAVGAEAKRGATRVVVDGLPMLRDLLRVKVMNVAEAQRRSLQPLLGGAPGDAAVGSWRQTYLSGREPVLQPLLLDLLGVTRVLQCYAGADLTAPATLAAASSLQRLLGDADGEGSATACGASAAVSALLVACVAPLHWIEVSPYGPYRCYISTLPVSRRTITKVVLPAEDREGYNLAQHFQHGVMRFIRGDQVLPFETGSRRGDDGWRGGAPSQTPAAASAVADPGDAAPQPPPQVVASPPATAAGRPVSYATVLCPSAPGDAAVPAPRRCPSGSDGGGGWSTAAPNARRPPPQATLIHCSAGMHRSCGVAVAYLLWLSLAGGSVARCDGAAPPPLLQSVHDGDECDGDAGRRAALRAAPAATGVGHRPGGGGNVPGFGPCRGGVAAPHPVPSRGAAEAYAARVTQRRWVAVPIPYVMDLLAQYEHHLRDAARAPSGSSHKQPQHHHHHHHPEPHHAAPTASRSPPSPPACTSPPPPPLRHPGEVVGGVPRPPVAPTCTLEYRAAPYFPRFLSANKPP